MPDDLRSIPGIILERIESKKSSDVHMHLVPCTFKNTLIIYIHSAYTVIILNKILKSKLLHDYAFLMILIRNYFQSTGKYVIRHSLTSIYYKHMENEKFSQIILFLKASEFVCEHLVLAARSHEANCYKCCHLYYKPYKKLSGTFIYMYKFYPF